MLRRVRLGVCEKHVHRIEFRGPHRRGARGVGFQHGHFTFHSYALHLPGGRAVQHRDWRVAGVGPRPLTVAHDDLCALQELAGGHICLERGARREVVVHSVQLALVGLARGGGERETKLIRELPEQLFEHCCLVGAQRPGDDEGLGRDGDHRRVHAPHRGLEVEVRVLELVVDHDVGEEAAFVDRLHLPRCVADARGNLLVVLRGART
mmetsp:Transcript_32595/g.82127  ORF Transcript_32595/g.82127 Transcript_32595/m.82127 type:complete len:208 (+) Transcript_32595:1339-1962(+)